VVSVRYEEEVTVGVKEEVVTPVVEDDSSIDAGEFTAELEMLDVGEGISAAVVVLGVDVEVELSIPGVPITLLPPSPAVLAKKKRLSSFILQQD
jgi:hypothetical protein